MRAKGRSKREGASEFISMKGSFPGLDFKYDKRRPPNASHPAKKPGESWPIGVSLTHRFCGGGYYFLDRDFLTDLEVMLGLGTTPA